MSYPLVTLGAGGFGRETLDVISALARADRMSDYHHLGVIDDAPSTINLGRLAERDVPYLGTLDDWLARKDEALFVVAVGSPTTRARLAQRLLDAGHRPATLIHPDASIGDVTTIGKGSVICAGARISTNVRIGDHVHINPNAAIGHDTTLGDCVSVNPGAVISGDVVVGSFTLIGAGAVILQQLTVGEESIVGAAACVVRDVPNQTTVKGVPAR